MYRYFTSFYPVKSNVHKLNPVVKLICLLILIVLTFITSSIKLEVLMLFVTAYLCFSSNVPLRHYFNTLYGLRYFFILLLVLLAARGLYLENALIILIKIVSVMLYLDMIFYTTSPSEIKYGIEKLLTPFNIFNVNTSPVINKLVNAITFFPLLFSTEREVLINASSRGLDYTYADIVSRFFVIIASFKNTFRLTVEKMRKQKLSSYLRGYSSSKYRTNLRTNKVGFYDIILLLVHTFFIIYYIFERGVLWDI